MATKLQEMKQRILETNNDWEGLVARLTIGCILFPHGAQKMLGLFGGYGFSGTMGFFTDTLHLPWIVGFMVIVIEFVGAMSLVVGFASRLWAFLIIMLMIGIITTSHLQNGFFMNWFGNQKGEGYEFHLLIIGLALSTVLAGSGRLSVDRVLMRK
jgi:putative oxidoreductase